jgi:hypothetical protein
MPKVCKYEGCAGEYKTNTVARNSGLLLGFGGRGYLKHSFVASSHRVFSGYLATDVLLEAARTAFMERFA